MNEASEWMVWTIEKLTVIVVIVITLVVKFNMFVQ